MIYIIVGYLQIALYQYDTRVPCSTTGKNLLMKEVWPDETTRTAKLEKLHRPARRAVADRPDDTAPTDAVRRLAASRFRIPSPR